MQNVHVLPIVVAAVAAWIFGAIYYGVLGRKWLDAQGKSMEQCTAEAATRSALVKAAPFAVSFIAELIMAAVLAGIVFHIGVYTIAAGLITGAICWFGFVATTVAVNNAYTFRRLALTIIDAGHWLGVLLVMGAILGAWGP